MTIARMPLRICQKSHTGVRSERLPRTRSLNSSAFQKKSRAKMLNNPNRIAKIPSTNPTCEKIMLYIDDQVG